MAANNGTTEKIINHANRHGSITQYKLESMLIDAGTDRETHKVVGDVNKSLRDRGETWQLYREGNKYVAYEVTMEAVAA